MPTLRIRFDVGLKRLEEVRDVPKYVGGVRFAGWEPNGQADAIPIPTGEEGAMLSVWHDEDRYYSEVHGNEDEKKRLVDLRLQETLRTGSGDPSNEVFALGPLVCELVLSDLSETTLEAVHHELHEHAEYVALGKRVAELICHGTSRYLNVIRYKFGQFWVTRVSSYKEGQSLKRYMLQYKTRWHNESDDKWHHLYASFGTHQIKVAIAHTPGRNDEQGITREDWEEVKQQCVSGYTPSISTRLLMRAAELLEHQQIRLAVIETATALEVAVNTFLTRGVDPDLNKYLPKDSRWKDMDRKALTVVAATLAGAAKKQIQDAVTVIDERNSLMHQGTIRTATLSGDSRIAVAGTLALVRCLLRDEVKKTPAYHITQVLKDEGVDD